MSDEPKVLPEDNPPKSGEWVDQEEFFADPTPEEVAEGEHLGYETPDVDFIETEDGTRVSVAEVE